MKPVWTLPEVAEHYRVSAETVSSWIAAGLLPAVNVAPATSKRKFWRITADALAEFERKRGTTPAPSGAEITPRKGRNYF